MKREVSFQAADAVKTVRIEPAGDHLHITIGNKQYDVVVRQQMDGHLLLEVDGQRLRVYGSIDGDRCYVWLAGNAWTLQRVNNEKSQASGRRALSAQPGSDSLSATMPGLVREVLVTSGDAVGRGATLVILEAMKMELRITAPHAGKVSKVHCAPGQVVERGQLLVEMNP